MTAIKSTAFALAAATLLAASPSFAAKVLASAAPSENTLVGGGKNATLIPVKGAPVVGTTPVVATATPGWSLGSQAWTGCSGTMTYTNSCGEKHTVSYNITVRAGDGPSSKACKDGIAAYQTKVLALNYSWRGEE